MYEPNEIPGLVVAMFCFIYLVAFTIRNIMEDRKDGK